MQLSRFFTLAEMTHSDTAQSVGIPNEPGAAETESLRALCAAVLDPLRESIGQAIRINSGYRSPKLNKHIGGARDSQHVKGEAADIESRGISPLELFQTIIRLALPFDQLIYEDKSATVKWVHVSRTTGGNRRQILKAKFAPGQPTTYVEMTAEAALARIEPSMRARGAVRSFRSIEMADEPGAVRRKPRQGKKISERAAPGRRKAAQKAKGKKAIPKSAKRPKAKRSGGKRRVAKAAPRKRGVNR